MDNWGTNSKKMYERTKIPSFVSKVLVEMLYVLDYLYNCCRNAYYGNCSYKYYWCNGIFIYENMTSTYIVRIEIIKNTRKSEKI